jgi:PGF-pre-PGF domain-containing protein
MTIEVSFMKPSEKSTEKILSLILIIALLSLTTALIVPVVNGASAVDLGSAGNYAILTKTGISTTGTTTITGNIGVSPIAATAITGFGLSMDPTNTFSRSSLVTGGVYAANYAPPTPATLTTAISNMESAYANAAGQGPPDATELYAGNLGGHTLPPGIYKWSTGVLIPSGTDLTLDAQGNGNAVWVFQVAADFTMNSASRVVLTNGAQAGNVYWQVAGPSGVSIGSGAHVEGNLLAQKAITLNSGASLHGRALAQTAVTLIANAITTPSPSSVPAQSSSGTVETSNSGATPTQSMAAGQTTTPTPTVTQLIITTLTADVAGNSGVYQVEVLGIHNEGTVYTGTIASGSGQGIGQPPGIVYQYIDLVSSPQTPADQAVVSFTVPLSWLDSNNVTMQNVVLYHLDGNSWTALPTTFVKTENSQGYFTATSPGFSLFAITGQFTPGAEPQSSAGSVSTYTQVPTPVAAGTTPVLVQPSPLPTPRSPLPVWISVTAVIGALLILAALSGGDRKNS